MNTGKRFVRWGVLILAVLIYIGIAAIPFVNGMPTASEIQTKNLKGIMKLLSVGDFVVLGIMLVILIAVVVMMLKKRDKVNSVAREYESEIKRITWFPWKDTKKSTVVVLLALVVCSLVICLLDLGLAKGILAFIDLF